MCDANRHTIYNIQWPFDNTKQDKTKQTSMFNVHFIVVVVVFIVSIWRSFATLMSNHCHFRWNFSVVQNKIIYYVPYYWRKPTRTHSLYTSFLNHSIFFNVDPNRMVIFAAQFVFECLCVCLYSSLLFSDLANAVWENGLFQNATFWMWLRMARERNGQRMKWVKLLCF